MRFVPSFYAYMKATEMYIRLNGLKIFAYHGVLPQENKVGAEYTINLRLKTDFAHAAETDRLEGTVSYAEVFQAVKDEMKIPSKLLEHAARRIAERILKDFPTVMEVKISLYKHTANNAAYFHICILPSGIS